MATILCVLYPDPQAGYPPPAVRDSIPDVPWQVGGEDAPKPEAPLGFTPGELVGSVSGELGLRDYLENNGHELLVTSDKDGEDSAFERLLPKADVVISQPFWPGYLTKERIAKAKKLKLAITAGIGSDHVDLDAAAEADITVAEVTGSNSESVAEHVVMMTLALVRNYLPSHAIAQAGGWNIADCVSRAYDVKGMSFGAVGGGAIGMGALRRLQPFGLDLHYSKRHRLDEETEKELDLSYHEDIGEMAKEMDILSLQIPLYPATRHIIDADMLSSMKRGTYLINCGRGELVDPDAVVEAVHSGQLAGYAGDVWNPQPPSAEDPWRTMPFNGMTPHVSGTTLSAQARYAAGALDILQRFLEGTGIEEDYLIIDGGDLAGTGSSTYQLS
ncbi:NAD-dependent formate dehydrogenase [Brachybacterium endophyticum]|uniref:NAD-dependent formate dehydrogenase n=1 Tax=Brachybacterium endophyticum TaxID=2182385 RepID=A0A2U2RL43_9MICO|nr:NAD-dependent formate dehydrogenase [Brachybacterium endophyticum]PWH06598.1 NAD-dependent formate dehydrogenase [Brachybacterium endophyticum]